MSGVNQKTKLYHYIGCTAACAITDGRVIQGKLLAYDRFLNLVVADAEEIQKEGKGDKEKEETRTLGLVILRGHYVQSITVMGALNREIKPEQDEIAHPVASKMPVRLPMSSLSAPPMPPHGMGGYPGGMPSIMPPGMPPGMPRPGYGPPPGMMAALPPVPPRR